MNLMAAWEHTIVSSDEMRYVEGRPEVRKYDACYYQINVDVASMTVPETEEGYVPRIFVQFYKKSNMNVFIYSGPNRFEALTSITDRNSQIDLNKNYTVDITEGFLIVAYPEKDSETEFEFHYHLEMYNDKTWDQMLITWDFNSDSGETVFLVFCVVAAVLVILFLCCLRSCFKMCMNKRGRI